MKRWGKAWRLSGLGALLLVAGLLLDVGLRDALSRLSDQLGDVWQRAQPRAATADPGVVVVDIDEASLQRIGQWPWPRDRVGELVDTLGNAGAAAIAFDMVFTEPDRTSLAVQLPRLTQRGIDLGKGLSVEDLDNDVAFAAAIARHPVVLGVAPNSEGSDALPPALAGVAYAGTDPRQYLPQQSGGLANLDTLTAAASGVGSFSFMHDADNVVRQMPLVTAVNGVLYPGLVVEALRVAQGASGIQLRSSDASHDGGVAPQLEALRVGEITLPSTGDGGLRVHFSGMPAMTVIPAWQVLEDAGTLAAQVEGRIVLIGTSAIGLRDIVATPLAPSVPGVFVHAELLDQAFNGQFLQRPDWARGVEVTTAIVVGLLLILALLPRRALPAVLAFIVLSGLVVYLSWWTYSRHQWLLDPLPALLVLSVLFASLLPVLLFAGNRDRKQIRDAFGHYLSPALVQRLAEDPKALRLGGESREISVLFSDIRGFTTLSESLEPTELTELLNGFLTPMTDVLLACEATIDKYIGDAIMAFWNAPLAIDLHPRKACLGALGMLEAVNRLNAEQGTALKIGVGVHCGQACVGNLGSQQRFSYSAIGDTVNLAARVEGLTKQYGVSILITGALQAQVPELATVELDWVRVVGRSEPVSLYALLGDAAMARDPAFVAMAQGHGQVLALYRQGDFAGALSRLPDVESAACPGLVDFYPVLRTRLLHLLGEPPTQWDGVFTARSK